MKEEEKLENITYEVIIKKRARCFLENLEKRFALEYEQMKKVLKESKDIEKIVLNPNLIILSGILQQQIVLIESVRQSIKDIIDLDWKKEETPFQYMAMKHFIRQSIETCQELRKEAILLGYRV